MSQPSPIFITYVEHDRQDAERLHGALRAAGLSPWCAAVDIRAGQYRDEAIVQALGRAQAVAVLISRHWPAAGESGGEAHALEVVARAIARAQRRGVMVVPVRMDGVGDDRTPLGLHRVVPVDVKEGDFAPAVDALRSIVERAAGETTLPLPSTDSDQLRAMLIANGAPKGAITALDEHILSVKRQQVYHPRLEPAPGLPLDRWLLVEKLGYGGFAEVWSAVDVTTGQTVALKILHPQFKDHQQRRARFFRGARRMAKLRHRNIVEVHVPEAFAEGRHFFVMEYLAGGDLEAAVRAGRIDRARGLTCIAHIALALAEAHRYGLIHRDVKPSNILLDERGWPKLTDFDLVRAGDTTGGTRTGGMGTFRYAAPEAQEDARRVDARCDIYSLGMTVAFVLLGGRLPQSILREPAAVLGGVPGFAGVKREVLRAIDWEPDKRHRTATAFARALLGAIKADTPEVPGGADATQQLSLPRPSRPPGLADLSLEDEDEVTTRADVKTGAMKRQWPPLPSAHAARLLISSSTEANDGRIEMGPVQTKRLSDDVTIGRGSHQVITIDDWSVSKAHAVIHFLRGAHWLTDLDSTNGTLVEGQPIEGAVRLVHGQSIQFGGAVATYVVDPDDGTR